MEGLGAESDQVNVATGYARNYLLPQGLAIPLTQGNERRLAALRKQRQERELREAKDAKELAASFKHLMLVIKAKTGETGKMYGSVTPANIIEQLQEQFEIKLDRRKLHIEEPIRTVGDHEVELRLHSEVRTVLKVRVESSNPLPEPEPAAEGEAAPEAACGPDDDPEILQHRIHHPKRPLFPTISHAQKARTPVSCFLPASDAKLEIKLLNEKLVRLN